MYSLKLTKVEAELIDWLLYPGAWNLEVLNYLQGAPRMDLRLAVGYVIMEKADVVVLSEDDLKLLLVICPITNTWGVAGEDVGYALKQKLFSLKLGVREEQQRMDEGLVQEVLDAIASGSPNEDNAQDRPEGSSEAHDSTV